MNPLDQFFRDKGRILFTEFNDSSTTNARIFCIPSRETFVCTSGFKTVWILCGDNKQDHSKNSSSIGSSAAFSPIQSLPPIRHIFSQTKRIQLNPQGPSPVYRNILAHSVLSLPLNLFCSLKIFNFIFTDIPHISIF